MIIIIMIIVIIIMIIMTIITIKWSNRGCFFRPCVSKSRRLFVGFLPFSESVVDGGG